MEALFKKGKFRVFPISKIVSINPKTGDLSIEQLLIKDGLAIEQECGYFKMDKSPTYIVVTFIKYDEHEDSVELEPVLDRIIDIKKDDWEDFVECSRYAIDLVENENREAEE